MEEAKKTSAFYKQTCEKTKRVVTGKNAKLKEEVEKFVGTKVCAAVNSASEKGLEYTAVYCYDLVATMPWSVFWHFISTSDLLQGFEMKREGNYLSITWEKGLENVDRV